MMLRSRHSSVRVRMLPALLMAMLLSCTTDRPDENFVPLKPGTGDGNGGPDASTGLDGSLPDGAVADGGLYDPFEGCGAPPVSREAFSRRRLRSAALACTHFHLCGFASIARTLDDAVSAYADDPSETTLAAARKAYRAASGLWSRVELMQFGPLASTAMGAGKDMYQGQNLRDRVQAWPVVARCRVEEELIARAHREQGVEAVRVSARGLFALEYLLFYPGNDTVCSSGSATAQAWAELDREVLSARKRDYAKALTGYLAELSETLVDAYAPDGSFATAFVEASGYPSEQEALNVLGFSLVYVEREVKDWKLGVPAGLTVTAPVSAPESPFAGVGGENVVANLEGFGRIFEGCGEDRAGIGFDDWLEAAGHAELADDLEDALAGALTAARRLPRDLEDASETELAAAYEALRVLTTLMKAELFGAGSPLNLKLPATVEGDTD